MLGPGILPLITALWVIAITNAINLIDGLDGLAAGIVAHRVGHAVHLRAAPRVPRAARPATNIGPLIAAATCGICLGFLPSNFHPARLFMGDAGALLLGVLMSASTMVIGGRTPPGERRDLLLLRARCSSRSSSSGVPLIDMTFAIVRRTASGQGFHNADKDHIHHRLLRLGHGHRRTVVILWLWTALLSGMILFPLYEPSVNVFIPVGRRGDGAWPSTRGSTPGLKRNAVDDEPPGRRWRCLKWRFPQGDAIVFAVSDGRSAAS